MGAGSDVKGLFAGIVDEFGPVRGVVYCAGQQYIAPIRGTQRERLDELFQVNFMGAWSAIQAFSQKKTHCGPGSSFVAISSVAAARPEAGIVAYAASKAALNALVKGAAVECAPVRFNAIAPGFMHTEMTETNAHIYTGAFVEQLEKRSPLGLAGPDKVAALAEFLLSDDASHITGQIMTLDGGATLK
jgi:gluconate 5-dehydrogenase